MIRSQLNRRLFSHSPLNILFFGSDQFSIHSLKGINDLRQDGSKVGKLQVIARPPKWCGRKNSILRYPPIVKAAEELGLSSPLLCDTNADLVNLRQVVKDGQYNMIIAVSFGKLIPGKLINDVSYALNVHPSLLPRYKGASPIQYTLLNRDEKTGVTVQTLHPSKFDQGSIVARTKPLNVDQLLAKGITSEFEDDVPIKTAIMMDQLGMEGSNVLKDVITHGLYLRDCNETTEIEPSYAPKITTEMRQINWESDEPESLLNKLQVLGPIFTHKQITTRDGVTGKRILFHDLKVVSQCPDDLKKPGEFTFDESKRNLYVKCKTNCVQVNSIQFEGFKVDNAKQFMTSLRKRCGPEMAQQKVFL